VEKPFYQVYKAAGMSVEIHFMARKAVPDIDTIFPADDEEMVLDVNSKILERLGYCVLGARNGKEVVDVYRETREKMDLIIWTSIQRVDRPEKNQYPPV
jgi:PleD family two-component response regulator